MITKIQRRSGVHRLDCPYSIDALLAEFNPSTVHETGFLQFTGIGNRDVYNITSPFFIDGQKFLLGRVEPRHDEFNSEINFFIPNGDKWELYPELPPLRGQDPFHCFIGDELIIGGVEAWQNDNNQAEWKTVLRRRDFEPWRAGPIGMKGIRLVEYGDKIGVATRPQGMIGGLGTIGFTFIDSLEDLSEEQISRARLIEGLFAPGEWGGINQLKSLGNGKIGCLAHVARLEDGGKKSYYKTAFEFDPESWQVSNYRIIVTRAQYPEAEPKYPILGNVVYGGGWESNDTVDISYGGVGDSRGAYACVDHLFAA